MSKPGTHKWTTAHMCVDIRGALRNMEKKRSATKSFMCDYDGKSLNVGEARDLLYDELSKGRKVLPMGEECGALTIKMDVQGTWTRSSLAVNGRIVKKHLMSTFAGNAKMLRIAYQITIVRNPKVLQQGHGVMEHANQQPRTMLGGGASSSLADPSLKI